MEWRVRGGTQCVEARCPNKLQVGTIDKPMTHEAQVNLVSPTTPPELTGGGSLTTRFEAQTP